MGAYAGLKVSTVSGRRKAYCRTGNGEPVLLVHGITTYSFIWRKIIPLLAPHYDVTAVDLLGPRSPQRTSIFRNILGPSGSKRNWFVPGVLVIY